MCHKSFIDNTEKGDNILMDIKISGLYCEITSRCNFSCVHCYNDSKISGQDIPFEVLAELINSAKELDVPYVAFSGGEPTLHSQFEKLVSLINKNDIQFDLVTNGSRLILYEDVLSKVGHLQISLDGATSTSNDIIRGKGSFDRVIEQIKHLGNSIKNKITLKMVINANNYNEIVDYIDLAVQLKIPRVSFGWLNDLGRAQGKSNLSIEDSNKLKIIETINKQRMIRQNIEVVPLGTTEKCPYVSAIDDNIVRMSIRIDSNGDVYPCQLISCSQFSLGNIHNMKLNEILAADSLKVFFEFAKNRQSMIKECQECVWHSICKGGCIGDGMSEQSLYLPDRQCSLRRLVLRQNIMKRRMSHSDST